MVLLAGPKGLRALILMGRCAVSFATFAFSAFHRYEGEFENNEIHGQGT